MSETQTRKNFDLSARAYAGLVAGLLVVLFLAVNIISGTTFRGARLDLTETGQFTLSQGTLNTIRSLKEPIRLQFFYSETVGADIAQIRTYADRVRDLLEEYAARSNGLIKLEVIDPEPFTDAEDVATAHGLRSAQTETGDLLFFGLVGTNAIDGREVVPFFPQERARFLEYDLTEMIHRLNEPKKPVLGIVSSLPLETGPGGIQAAMQGQARPFLVYEQLRERFEIEILDQDLDAVPDSVDVLMIAHPKPLTEAALFAIDQFVLAGGRALVFLDPYSEVSGQGAPMGRPVPGTVDQSDLARLLGAWGVNYDASKVVSDMGAAQVVSAPLGGRMVQASYPIWLGLTDTHAAQDDLVTADLEVLNLATAGALSQAEGAQTRFQPLLTSSAQSMLIDRARAAGQPMPDDLIATFAPTPEHYVLAARISGPVSSAFPDGPPAPSETGDAPADAAPRAGDRLTASDGPINVIVMADSDIFDDRLWVAEQNLFGQRIAVPTADNAHFILNAVENLMGSNDLISLRTRASGDRPFTVVDNLRRKAERQFLEREQALQMELEAAEAQLRELQGRETGGEQAAGAFLSPEEEALADRVRGQMIETRRSLREVRRSLRAEIESLGNWLIFFNVMFVPLLVTGLAVGLAWLRAKRRRARTGLAAAGARA